MTCGFEHSIADMSIIGIGVANGGITVGPVSVYRTAGNSRKYNRRGSVCGSTVSCDFKRKIKNEKRKDSRSADGYDRTAVFLSYANNKTNKKICAFHAKNL